MFIETSESEREAITGLPCSTLHPRHKNFADQGGVARAVNEPRILHDFPIKSCLVAACAKKITPDNTITIGGNMVEMCLGYIFQMVCELRFPVTCTRHVSLCRSARATTLHRRPRASRRLSTPATVISLLTDTRRFARAAVKFSETVSGLEVLYFKRKPPPRASFSAFQLLGGSFAGVRRFGD